MSAKLPRTAMVLAAGRGVRMRPLTLHRPKPLVELAGKALLDHVLDRLADAGVARAVVNVHYLADQVIAHLAPRTRPQIIISDERDMLLDTGGGVVKALTALGADAFFHVNSDTVWTEPEQPALRRLAEAWNDAAMDMLLLLAQPDRSLGYEGAGDFVLASDGRLRRRQAAEGPSPVYMGAAILHPRIFGDAPAGAFSLNLLFDRAIAQGRLFGLAHDGRWMHVGTPDALRLAEEQLAGGAR